MRLRHYWQQIVRLATVYKRHKIAQGEGITILVPFQADNNRRAQTWHWLQRYYSTMLPRAQIITCHSDEIPFCKTAAFNRGVKDATGDIFVLMDADCYTTKEVLLACAANIRSERRRGYRLWYIPYRHFFRLTNLAAWYVLTSDPADPFTFTEPPRPQFLEEREGTSQGHWFAALIQIMPREAFEEVGGMDERFKGWGGEDLAFMRAVDTLWAKHKTLNVQVLHLWHPKIGTIWTTRKWEGQKTSGSNNKLASRYYGAIGNRRQMRNLVEEARPNESGY